MQWIDNNPWPVIIAFVAAAIVGWLLSERHGRTIAIGCTLLAAGVWLLDQNSNSVAEQVEDSAQALLNGFIAQDINAIQARISDTKPELKETAEKGLKLVRLAESFHMKDVEVEVADSGTEATMRLRANGPVTLQGEGYSQNAATRWETSWILEGGTWKLSDYKRLSVINNKPIGAFDAVQ